jgi:hypothetical protein
MSLIRPLRAAWSPRFKQLSTFGNIGDPNFASFAVAAELAMNSIRGPNWLISILASAILAAFKSRASI